MATAGEGRAPYESSGAGGKFRKKPFRRSAPATPYDRPPTALRNKNPGLLTKLVDPASRLIYAGAHKLFNVFRNRLPPLSLQGPPEINEEPQNVSQEAGQNNSIGVSKSIDQDGNSAATGISDLEQMLKQKTFTRSEIQHLTSLLHSRTTELPLSDNIEINGANPNPLLRLEASTSGSMKKHSAFSTPFVSSKVVEEETPSPAELAKSYMGTITRPTKLINNTTTSLQKTPSITPKKTANDFKNLENGFMTTPRTRGRSAMYSMARTPYSKSPNQKGLMMSDYNSQGSSLKRRSSVLDDDFGTGGPLRRTRQKPNLLLDKRELGYTTFQQQLLLRNEPEENSDISMDGSRSKSTHVSVPEKSTQTAAKIFQHLESLTPKSPTKLTSNMLHGQALKSLEKMDSPKFVPVSHDNGESTQKSKVQKFDNGGGSTSTSKGKEKVEEDGPRKFPVPFNMLTAGNGDVAVSVKESEEIVAIDEDDLVSKLPPEPPQNKRAFQMSIDDDDYDDDNDDDIIHVNGHVSFPPVENNKPETSLVPNKPVSADISEPATPPEVFKTPAPVEATPVVVPEVAKVVEPEKAKPPPETGFKFSSTFTTQKDEVTPAEKVSPFQFSEYKPKESSDPKPVESTSIFSTETKNDVTNENGNDKKVENIPAATSASGMFSFASSAKTPDSTPSVFSSLTPIPASGGNSNTSSLFSNTSNSNVTPVSLPTPVFSFGSGKPTTSMPETSNNKDAVVEKEEPKSTISSPFFAATSTTTTTTTTNGGGLFGFGSQAATSTTTTNGGSLFGFSAPAATTTATNGGGLFGFSSPAATSTATSTGNGGAPFGFSSSAATSTTTAATTTNAGAIFGFSAPATTSTTTAAASSGGALFGFTAPATTSTTTSFFNTTSTSSTPVTQSAPFLFGSGSTTSPFGSSAPASSNSTTGPTTTVFGSSWQQPQNNSPVFSFGASSSATQSSPVFSFNTSGPTKPSFTPVFGSQTPTFPNNDQMSMEDSMAEDSMQTPTPVASSPFGQPAPGFMFGVPNPAPPVAAAPFQFGGPAANQQPPPQNPFQSSSLEFNGGGGSFSLGSGGDKSGRRIVRVNKSKNRRK